MLRAFEVSQTQANSDSLTGLMTRRSLETAVRELHATGTPYSVAYGDLDHFKDLNDNFGHAAGDRALRTFSQVLRDSLRPANIPGRYGGEEFVIVLPECPVEEARQVLERVRDRMAERIVIAELPPFTVSFGVASSDQAADFDQVVSLADAALLSAKAGAGTRSSSQRDRTGPQRPPVSVRPDGPAGGRLRGDCLLSPLSRSGQRQPGPGRPGSARGDVRGRSRRPPWRLPAPWRRVEMRKPSPLASVHLMPAVDEEQVNGARVIDMP